MADYAELIKTLRYCNEYDNCGSRCPRFESNGDGDCVDGLMKDAADAIEELLARVSENDWRVCENCSLQHFDTDGMRWCEELSMVVGGNFYCGFFEGSEPPKEVE